MTICIGKSIIQALAKDGEWQSESGEAVVAADELFHQDPYAEIERLRAEVKRLRADIEYCGENHVSKPS